MSIGPIETLKANLVLLNFPLLDRPGEFEAFRAKYKEARPSGSVNVDVQTGVREEGRVITLDRERITLELYPSRAVIERGYPTNEVDIHRLAEVSHHAIDITSVRGKALRAYGYNLEVTYDQDSGQAALEYLAGRLVSNGLQQVNGWRVRGASSRLVYMSDEGQWNVAVEPRFGDPNTTIIFMSTNLHKNTDQLPTLEEIRQSLVGLSAQVAGFANFLDEHGR